MQKCCRRPAILIPSHSYAISRSLATFRNTFMARVRVTSSCSPNSASHSTLYTIHFEPYCQSFSQATDFHVYSPLQCLKQGSTYSMIRVRVIYGASRDYSLDYIFGQEDIGCSHFICTSFLLLSLAVSASQ